MPDLRPFGSRDDFKAVEEGPLLAPKFNAEGLLPAVATDHLTGELLMVAWMNEEAFRKTLELGEAVYYSRSRKELWHKGATSGLVQKVREIRVDCDQDTVWLKVEAIGGASCHTGHRSCFFRKVAEFGPAANERGPIRLETTEATKAFDPETVYGKKSG
jgi:phosphoribosyl-AMP cyclohydrolase